MAITKMTKDGFGQIEMNHVAWRRDGRMLAQTQLDGASEGTDFYSVPAENGTLLRVDVLSNTIKFPTSEDVKPVYGVMCSSELIYDERTRGLKHFSLPYGGELPRLGLPSIGDAYTTNAIAFDTDEYATEEDLIAVLESGTTSVYAEVRTGSEGHYVLTENLEDTNGFVAIVKEYTTMPDGQKAVKLQVVSV